MDGVPLVPVVLGLFAIPEVIDLLLSRGTIASQERAAGDRMRGLYDCFKNWWLIVRCGTIGTVCGMIPGLGGPVAEWLGYGHAVQTAKDSSMFGKGDVRGVIAPEAATAAQKPGGILPTVAFGIPGNAAMAVMLGVFFISGLRPGPEMLRENLSITFLMVWVTVAANIIAAVLAYGLQRWLVLICYVRATILAPIVLSFMVVGAVLATRDHGDVLMFGLFGFLGYLLRKADWPRVPMLIGMVLGNLAETYLFITVKRYGFAWLWQRPIVIAILVLILLSFAITAHRRQKARKGNAIAGEGKNE
jgi:TctA family transporter